MMDVKKRSKRVDVPKREAEEEEDLTLERRAALVKEETAELGTLILGHQNEDEERTKSPIVSEISETWGLGEKTQIKREIGSKDKRHWLADWF